MWRLLSELLLEAALEAERRARRQAIESLHQCEEVRCLLRSSLVPPETEPSYKLLMSLLLRMTNTSRVKTNNA